MARPVAAQMPTTPAQVISVYREDVKPARGYLHQVVEHGYTQHWAKNGVKPFLALDAMSGNAAETMFVSSYPTWQAFEEDFKAYGKASSGPEFVSLAKQEAELVSGVRATVATYREDLSYRGDRLVQQLPQARYVMMRTIRVKPGHEANFADVQHEVIKTHAEAKMDEEWVIYQVTAGAPAGTFLFFQPIRSLQDVTTLDDMHKKYEDGLSAELKTRRRQLQENDITFEQRDLYAFNPTESYVSTQFAAASPEFWTPKTTAVAKTAGKPGTEKLQARKPEPSKP
jgi:hypothetical protein